MSESLYSKKIREFLQVSKVESLRTATVSLLTPDASTRRYYRLVTSGGQSYVASVYPEAFQKAQLSFLIMTDILAAAGLPVPKVFEVHEELGVVLQEDLGDVSLTQWLAEYGRTQEETDSKIKEAIILIARIQALTSGVLDAQSLPATLAFDTEKLNWELSYFFEHFFGSLLHIELPDVERAQVKSELLQLAEWLSARPRVLTHRDFHAMNLMVDASGQLRLIDYQDARMGPLSYDLVPLLLERRMQPPSEEWVSSMQEYFLQARVSQGLPMLDSADFQKEFMYMTVQRELKALGTFSYQTAVMGRGVTYQAYIVPTVKLVLAYLDTVRTYPRLQAMLARSLQYLE
ncbi:MAG: phosphotransferase [Candidatus Doudnabacteria bacterium]|nr:phosphotransferase [Candidatus Doudnabacteria bacterium]